jgi:hypothetical protein
MFNWTTTTLINELPEKFVMQPLDKDGHPIADRLRIGKHLFEKRWVESIRKAEGHKEEICEAKLDLAKVYEALAAKYKDATVPSVARLFLYVGLDGSEESIYANDWYRKGMPLSVSFAVSSDADAMAKAIADTVKTFNVFTKVKKVLDVEVKEAEPGILYIKGTHEHQRLQKIQVLVDAGFGEEVAIVNYELNHPEVGVNANAVAEVNKGMNGFGTYSQLLKDLRLPTAVHNHWLSVQKDEMPIVGALYTQYIINYYAPSTANPSFTAVGNRSMSETTHVFWVNTAAPAKDKDGNPSTVGAEWEKALAAIDPDGGAIEKENKASLVD